MNVNCVATSIVTTKSGKKHGLEIESFDNGSRVFSLWKNTN